MAVSLDQQALRLLLALALGVGLGLLYDLLRPLRRRGAAVGTALDVLFCAMAACSAFLYAMGAGSGRLGLWELCASLLGFLLYLHSLSLLLLPLFEAALRLLLQLLDTFKNFFQKCGNSAKKFFQKMRK